MTNLKLRPYQEECLEAIKEAFQKGVRRQLIHMATGSGKTVVFSALIKQLQKKTLVLAHTTELLDQAKDKLRMICPELDIGLVQAGSKEYDRSVVLSTIQSAKQKETLEELKKQGFNLCVYDEAHRAGADSARFVLSSLGFLNNPEYLLVGCSATPFRNDSKGLGEVFDQVVYKKTIKDLVALGFLCKPVGVKIKTDLDLSSVKSEDGDFLTQSLASVMNTPEMIRVVVDAFIEKAVDRKTVCFGVTVDHAKKLVDAFKNCGIAAEAIYGSLPIDMRSNLLDRFQRGDIQVLVNCQILTEGWDCPEVDCVLVAKPTQSKGLYQQMCGRGLRLYPNKRDCLILDFGSKSHSLCSVSVLAEDSEPEKAKHKQLTERKMSEFAKTLPPSLNKKLRASIIEFDPLGDDFQWVKDGQTYFLKAIGDKVLKILPTIATRFNVIFFNGKNSQIIARELSFEYAFACAEGFAKDNRSHFIVSDMDANWRHLPISDKQRGVFKSYGYRSGIDELSRGQAALLIASGALNKKAVRR